MDTARAEGRPQLTPQQLRMARAGLGVNVRDLAKMAEVAPYTITRFETGRGGEA